MKCQVGSTFEKRVLNNKKNLFSGPFTLKMLCQVCLCPRSLNLCLDFRQLDGKGVKKVIKHTNRHECQVGSTIKKRVLENLKNLYFWSYHFENALLGAPWPKESKSVLRFYIAGWEGGQKLVQVRRRTQIDILLYRLFHKLFKFFHQIFQNCALHYDIKSSLQE